MRLFLLRSIVFFLLIAGALTSNAGWTDDSPIPNQTSDYPPALAFFNSALQLAYRAESTVTKPNDFIYSSLFSNGTWGTASRLAGEKAKGAGPALATTSTQLILFHRGENKEGRVYIAVYGGGKWSPGTQIKGVTGADELAATSDASGNLYLVYRDSKGNVWYTTATGTAATWSAPVEISNVAAKSIALANLSGTLHLAYGGKDDNNVHDCLQNGSNWTCTSITGAEGNRGVGLGVAGGVLYLAYVGKSKENLWFSNYNNGAWSTQPTEIPNHESTGSPALAGDPSSNTLYMVHRGKGGEQLYFSQYTP